LTGIGPLIAWRKTSIPNLKRQFAVPVGSALVAAALLLAAGIREFYALVALAIAAFVLGTVAQEFVRGIRARRRLYGESLPVAAGRLVGRNRRRYGGYIVHVAIVVYFVAFTGGAFKVTREATLRVGESM